MRDYQSAVVITPNDSTLLANPSLALLASVDSTVKVDMIHTGTGIILSIKAGVVLRVRVTKVYATGTNLNSGTLVALY